MADHTIYTRVYSESSAGKLSSAKGPIGDALTHTELLNEFRNHANRGSTEPTALISVSNRIIDTVRRAFDKFYTDEESPADIWIAFIGVPFTTSVHAARLLAEECGIIEPHKFHHEYVFERIIPDEYVLHTVSLQTLIDRGLDWEKYLFAGEFDEQVASTSILRSHVAMNLQPENTWYGSSEVGIYLGLFAQKFGSRAPVDWIAHQLFYDCARKTVLEADVVKVDYACGSSQTVNFGFFSQLDDGIDTALYRWWLGDIDFYHDLKEFEEWQDMMECWIVEDEADFWEIWDVSDSDGIVRELSERETLLRDEAWDRLMARREEIKSSIEVKAVKIGL